jgi:hypothetical protein
MFFTTYLNQISKSGDYYYYYFESWWLETPQNHFISIDLLDEFFFVKNFVQLVGAHYGECNNLSAYLCWIGT